MNGRVAMCRRFRRIEVGSRSALTLVEVVVALGIGTLVWLMISQFLTQSGRQYRQSLLKVDSQKELLLFIKYLQNDLAHLREYQAEEPRHFRKEKKNLFEVQAERLSFATSRGERITYTFESQGHRARRSVEMLENEELSVRDLVLKKVQERAEKTFALVKEEVMGQVREKVGELREVFQLGDPGAAQDPAALTQKATEIFAKLQYYTGTDGADSGFATDLQDLVTGKAERMASEIGYGVEADAEEIMGTLLSRYFQMEELAPPRFNRSAASERSFPLKVAYRVIREDGVEEPPAGESGDGRPRIVGFRFTVESVNPTASLESLYQKQGLAFLPNALLLSAGNRQSRWNQNPPPRVKLQVMDLITTGELTGRYYGEAIIPDANILYKSWVEIPEFWFLDIFNTEEEVAKLRKGLINPDEAEPKK